jgi:hypothetical protein
MKRARCAPKRTRAERDAAHTERDIGQVLKARVMVERWPHSAWRDEMLALTDRELGMLRDPAYQAARLEAERSLAHGRQVPRWAVQALFSERPIQP